MEEKDEIEARLVGCTNYHTACESKLSKSEIDGLERDIRILRAQLRLAKRKQRVEAWR